MPLNAAGIDVSGAKNPKWRGGLIKKTCEVCKKEYFAKRAQEKSKYCSMQCVGISQRGKKKDVASRKIVEKECEICGNTYSVPKSHEKRYHCCSKQCSFKRRAEILKGDNNPNWNGGLSRLPYPWNFKRISGEILRRDGYSCQSPLCRGNDARLTAHHINYDKQDCRDENLITLCSSCNSKANFGRDYWEKYYQKIIAGKRDDARVKIKVAADAYPFAFFAVQKASKSQGGGWITEEF